MGFGIGFRKLHVLSREANGEFGRLGVHAIILIVRQM
ncbi:hypothetical protein J2T57_003825 [Natronocella acetinitrilica]|uniref:Uncharacterized protein n=1 Tax=Natronocella acetinitrilica TaxID=414046 RepID=A0AAE3KDA9_9GAMM|nr:hypothetical protein [Natronocella acetinitrilica]